MRSTLMEPPELRERTGKTAFWAAMNLRYEDLTGETELIKLEETLLDY